jgi:plasmid stabilization system protein ParE
MPASSPTERLVVAQSEVRRACDLLVAASPEALERCQEALQHAVTELAGFRSKCRELPGTPAVRSLAYGLRAEVLRAGRLLQSLSGFYRGWERILGAMSAGYTATGDPAPVVRHGRFCCRG